MICPVPLNIQGIRLGCSEGLVLPEYARVAAAEDGTKVFLTAPQPMHRCGNHQGLIKKTLTKDTQDIRGHFAHHATALLNDTDA